MIGIEDHSKRFFEGSNPFLGRELWPPPMVSVATVLKTPEDYGRVPESLDLRTVELLFREDHFDAVTRIKRGRFYMRHGSGQPQEWKATYAISLLAPSPSLCTFSRWPATIHLNPPNRVQIALGGKGASSIWNVVGIERIVTDEDLVTLRARTALGVLPDLELSKVPREGATAVEKALEGVADSVFRAGPVAVIDRCRDAAQVALSVSHAATVGDQSVRHVDLWQLTETIERHAKDAAPVVLLGAARIIARLHARAKPNEQERRKLRPVEESDAEAAVSALGLLIRELGWTAA